MDDEKIKSKSMRSSTAPRPGGRCPKGSNAEGSSAELHYAVGSKTLIH